MAKAVTLKNQNNEEVYPVTDFSLVNGTANTGKITDGAVTTAKIASNAVTTAKIADSAVTAAKIDFSTLGVAATVTGPSSTTSLSNGAAWASVNMYTGTVTLDAGVYLVITTGSTVTFSAGGEQEWSTVAVDGVGVAGSAIAYFSGAFPAANPIGIAIISASGSHSVAYQLGAQGNRTCTLYSGSKIQFVRIG